MRKITCCTLVLLLTTAVCQAKPIKRHHSKIAHNTLKTISGYPMGNHKDMTINGNSNYMVDMTCHFTNTQRSAVTLNLWTEPTARQPYSTVVLKPGTPKKPYRQSTTIRLRLFQQWWCHIYTPADNAKFNYCTYFAIADQKAKQYRPFSIHQKRAGRRDGVRFECSIDTSKHPADFFSLNTTEKR